MLKSARSLCILSIIIAIIMIMNTFSYIEFTGNPAFRMQRIGTYFITFLMVFNAGFFTQKYLQARKDRSE